MAREGGKCKPVTASLLLTAPGLRDSSSPRFPRCRFNSISSPQSSFILPFFIFQLNAFNTFLFFWDVALGTFHTTGDHFFTTWLGWNYKGRRWQRTIVRTAFSPGTLSFSLRMLRRNPLCLRSLLSCPGKDVFWDETCRHAFGEKMLSASAIGFAWHKERRGASLVDEEVDC